jgi:hypothetical protein
VHSECTVVFVLGGCSECIVSVQWFSYWEGSISECSECSECSGYSECSQCSRYCRYSEHGTWADRYSINRLYY